MVLVNCMWKQEEIIKEIESIEVNGMQIFKHIATEERMRMYFTSMVDDEVRNIAKATFINYNFIMAAISRIPGWQALAISVLPVVNNSKFEGYNYTVCRSRKTMRTDRLLKE